MKRRVVAAIAAVLLAGLGAVLLLGYVGNADRRAMAGMQPHDVLVVVSPVPEGTKGDALGKLVSTRTVPAASVAEGALSSVATISGQVATTNLQPGEQVLASRFVDPASLERADDIPVPRGFQQLAVSLDRQRVLGGQLTAGSSVGVFVSLPKDGESPAQTHLVQHRVLVTKVDDGTTTSQPAGDTTPAANTQANSKSNSQADPEAALMVTLAVNAHDAEVLVYGAEHGTLWLSLEPTDAVVSGTRVVTRKNVDK